MTIKEKAKLLPLKMEEIMPNVKCELNASNPYELLFATILSAQSTDKKVNQITPELFSKYKTLDDYAIADIEDVCKIIRPCGLTKLKSNGIIGSAQMLINKFNCKIPDNMEDLLTLPSVGRKTANLILGEVYDLPSITADTHCIRLSNRLGFVKDTTDAVKVEFALKKYIAKKYQTKFSHRLVLYGRYVCTSQNPKCTECEITEFCNMYKKLNK